MSQLLRNGVTAVARQFRLGGSRIAGKELEARLRQQHTKLNPRTSWAQVDKKKRTKRKPGFGDESDEE